MFYFFFNLEINSGALTYLHGQGMFFLYIIIRHKLPNL